MATAISRQNGDEARLWAAALCISAMVNGILLAWISYEVITAEIARRKAVPEPVATEQVVTIFPEMIQETQAPPPEVEPAESKFARTAPDQDSAEPPASRRYIGERDTVATSDAAPTDDAPEMPSQAGREPEEMEQPETTESDYQDGALRNETQAAVTAPPVPPTRPDDSLVPEPLSEIAKGIETPDPGEAETPQTAIREKLFDGPNPIETPAPEAEIRSDIKPREELKAREGKKDGLAEAEPVEKPKETARPKPQPIDDPAFRGNQSKTAIQGSISRTGRSALDVADTPMGRYQAQISKAVELEWQRNCVRRRDFIVPGYLTARFFVTEDGTVKSVNFLGEIEGGAIQKGFTLDSIRDAPIPPMPPAVKKEMAGDALELIFNFYF